MPRFTLRQLMIGVFSGCVLLSLLRDLSAGVRHVSISVIVVWTILAIFYFKWRLWVTLFAHGLPVWLVITSYEIVVLLEIRTGVWRNYPIGQVLSYACGVGSLVVFPMALIGLSARYSKARPSP